MEGERDMDIIKAPIVIDNVSKVKLLILQDD